MKKKIVFLLVILLVSPAAYSESEIDGKIRELEKKLETVSGKEKIGILFQLADITSSQAPDKCIGCSKQVIDLAGQFNDPGAKAMALRNMSFAYNVKGDQEKAREYTKEALAIYENQGNRIEAANTMNELGMLYINVDYFNTAQDYLLKALEIREEFGDKDQLCGSYLYLGILYDNLEDHPKAMKYHQKAMTMARELKRARILAYCFLRTGLCCHKSGDSSSALDYLQKALAFFEGAGDNYYSAISLSNIGDIYGKLNRHNQALTYLFKAQNIQEKNGYKDSLLYTKYYIGNVYRQMKDYAKAPSYYDRAIKIAGELKNKKMLEKVYKSCSGLYADTGDYKKAFQYYKLYSQTRESILDEKKIKQIAELEMRFDAEKREKEIEILKKDNKFQKLARDASIIGLCMLLIILALVFKKYLYLLAFWKTHKYIWQYRIIEKIGSGGMGTVYRTHAVSDKNHLVAVKVLREELVEDEASRRRFKQEGTIIDKLQHPHIVKIYERGEHKGKLYIAMEYLRGKTLVQKIKEENKIDMKECFHIMIQVTDALAFIHSKNVVHRDIKPANIMLIQKDAGFNFVKLLDFGVALMKFQTRLTQSGFLVGTISYTAPEQITDNLYSPASDVYSMGIAFYEMLTGEPAFQAENVTAVVEKIIDKLPREPVKSRPGIPGELNRLIVQMLSKEPGQRPTAAEVLTALENMNPFYEAVG